MITRFCDNLIIEFKRFASRHGIIDHDPRDAAEEMRYDFVFNVEPTQRKSNHTRKTSKPRTTSPSPDLETHVNPESPFIKP